MLATGSALCAETVLFADGRSLEIDGHAPDSDGSWVLRVQGGSLHVPRDRVVGFQAEALQPSSEPDPAATLPPVPETAEALAARLARELDVEPSLVAAVMAVESGGDPFAVSPKGAVGLMQLMPATARSLGVNDVFDPGQNLRGGILHLKTLLDRYHGDYGLALAAYNAGTGAVTRHKGIPPYRETTGYVIHVLNRYLAK